VSPRDRGQRADRGVDLLRDVQDAQLRSCDRTGDVDDPDLRAAYRGADVEDADLRAGDRASDVDEADLRAFQAACRHGHGRRREPLDRTGVHVQASRERDAGCPAGRDVEPSRDQESEAAALDDAAQRRHHDAARVAAHAQHQAGAHPADLRQITVERPVRDVRARRHRREAERRKERERHRGLGGAGGAGLLHRRRDGHLRRDVVRGDPWCGLGGRRGLRLLGGELDRARRHLGSRLQLAEQLVGFVAGQVPGEERSDARPLAGRIGQRHRALDRRRSALGREDDPQGAGARIGMDDHGARKMPGPAQLLAHGLGDLGPLRARDLDLYPLRRRGPGEQEQPEQAQERAQGGRTTSNVALAHPFFVRPLVHAQPRSFRSRRSCGGSSTAGGLAFSRASTKTRFPRPTPRFFRGNGQARMKRASV